MPAPRSWTRIVIASGSGPGLDDLEVDVAAPVAPRRRQVDGARRRRRRPRVRVADARGGRPGDRGWCRASSSPRARSSRLTAPMSTRGVDRERVVGRASSVDAALAGVGQDALRLDDAVAHGERLGEAADAVAAHLGPAAVGVVQRHPRRRSRRPARRPAGRRRRCRGAVAHARGRTRTGRRSWTSNTTRKSLPRPWCLVSVMVVGRIAWSS